MATTTFNFSDEMENGEKSIDEASSSESETELENSDDWENNENSQDAYEQLYDESCKLIETISKQQSKNKRSKDKLEHVNNDKNSLAKELENVKYELKKANEDLCKFKGLEDELEVLKFKTHP